VIGAEKIIFKVLIQFVVRTFLFVVWYL